MGISIQDFRSKKDELFSAPFGDLRAVDKCELNKEKQYWSISIIGLNLEIFIDQDNYMSNRKSEKSGAKIVLHDSKMTPLPDEYGIGIRPGTATSIAIQKSIINRLKSPYQSNCTDGWENTSYDIDGDVKYSLAVRNKCLHFIKI